MKVTSAVFVLLAVFSLTLDKTYGQEEVELIAAAPSANSPGQARIRVQSFRFDGNTVIATDALQKIVAPHQDKEVSLGELQNIAGNVTEYYHKKGYFLARVLLPEQEITGGVVTFQVLEGRLGEIVISGNQRYSEGFIRNAFSHLIHQKVIRQDTLERALLTLNDNPSLEVTSRLQAGREPGTTDIAVMVKEHGRMDGALEFNTFGTRYSDRERISPNIDFQNLTGRGDSLSLRIVSGADPSDLFFGRVGYSVPMGASGTRLHLYVLSGDFEVGREFSILNIEGEGTSYGVALTRPLYKSRAKNVTLELGLDAKDAEQRLLGAITSDDKIRSVRAGVHFNTVDRKGRTVASVFVHHGLGDAIGGMEDNEPLSSRVGADGRFTKLTVEAARVRRFSAKSFLIVRASGQVTNRSLVVGEQIAIGGADSVRGYPQSEFLGDRGLQVSLEWRIAPRADKLDKLQFALFVDHGVVEVKNPVVGQNKSENITGVGFGIRANLGGDISVRADLGFSVGQNPSSGGSAIPYVQIIKRF